MTTAGFGDITSVMEAAEEDPLQLSHAALQALTQFAQERGVPLETSKSVDVLSAVQRHFDSASKEEAFEQTYEDEAYYVVIRLHGLQRTLGQTLNSTGLTLWRAAEHMAHFIFHNRDLFADRSVVELGAGLGLCSILLDKLQLSEVIISTDGDDDTLGNLHRNAAMNDTQHVLVEKLVWGQHEPFLRLNPRGFQIVIGADIIYEPQALEPLFETARAIMEPAEKSSGASPVASFYLAFARRNIGIDKVLHVAVSHGFDVEAMEEKILEHHPEEPIYRFTLQTR